jgi:NDP-sugar pyrophosphorylase family protein
MKGKINAYKVLEEKCEERDHLQDLAVDGRILKRVLRTGCECVDKIHLKNSVFWDVTLCGSYKNRCFGGM